MHQLDFALWDLYIVRWRHYVMHIVLVIVIAILLVLPARNNWKTNKMNTSWQPSMRTLSAVTLCLCSSVCLSLYMLIGRLSVCILDSLSVCLSFCLPICLFVSLSLFLSARLSVCSSIRPFVCPSVYLVYFQLQPLGLCRKLARPASPAEQNAWVAWEWKLEIISRAPCCCIAQMFLNRAT